METPKTTGAMRAAQKRYRATPGGKEATRAAQKRYRASAKGKEAARRSRDKYDGYDAEQRRNRAHWREVNRRETRKQRIMRGLPPDVPAWSKEAAKIIRVGGRDTRVYFETPDPALESPYAKAAALALEDLL